VWVFRGRRGDTPVPWKRILQPGLDEEGDLFGSRLAAADLDDRPGADLLISALHERPNGSTAPLAGQVYLYMGVGTSQPSWDGLVAETLVPSGDEDAFGASVATGDVDGDRRPDVIVGMPGHDLQRKLDAGAAVRFERGEQVFAPRCLLHQAVGAGCSD
jgi:hypothetical protein